MSEIRDLGHSTAPDDSYLDEMARQTRARAGQAAEWASDFTGAPETSRSGIAAGLDAAEGDLTGLLHTIHDLAETAFEEFDSVAAIASVLKNHGVDVETGLYGVKTTLRATTGSGHGRTIAILAEYDALPEIGHACGHNIIATAGVGAFLALHALYEKDPDAVPGTVVLLGTPAEEGHSGKEVMARAGAFDGIDAAIMVHSYGYDCADQVWLGRRLLKVTYSGVAAHASAQPFMGRNALDAANLFYQGLGLMRQQMPPISRLHAVITDGGTRPSIITETATVQCYVRSKFPETLKELSDRVEDAAKGAALMTGTGVTVDWDEHPPSLPVRTNQALTARWAEHEQTRGRRPLPAGVLDESIAASTDFGNVSYRIPGIHPLIKTADAEVALHTREFAAAARTPAAETAALDAAYGLACTALDFLVDDALAAEVTEEFARDGGAIDVEHFFD
ncbi:amidohydrolase [Brevibacterium iodinum ATCC 49514]|uniref:Peptidase M20 domain-containing protein 2 n=1 Tax=Brevibacterium iodinum ATCC 49514 TaxID=1255616 RepID=A0A2H1K013_9MICO|nr:M20 family metallopeptidase [Brevibacterium iodinum]SMX93053.1 amidohydrolase [Brevibacterium iodinum ATCC 49514]SUW12944.1 Aminobenzoyl-glutamate utilization protein B [Brevibacterium iodinum]